MQLSIKCFQSRDWTLPASIMDSEWKTTSNRLRSFISLIGGIETYTYEYIYTGFKAFMFQSFWFVCPSLCRNWNKNPYNSNSNSLSHNNLYQHMHTHTHFLLASARIIFTHEDHPTTTTPTKTATKRFACNSWLALICCATRQHRSDN